MLTVLSDEVINIRSPVRGRHFINNVHNEFCDFWKNVSDFNWYYIFIWLMIRERGTENFRKKHDEIRMNSPNACTICLNGYGQLYAYIRSRSFRRLSKNDCPTGFSKGVIVVRTTAHRPFCDPLTFRRRPVRDPRLCHDIRETGPETRFWHTTERDGCR